jgi:uncharacterized membrane protein
MRILIAATLMLGVASTTATAGSFTSLDDAPDGFLTALSRNGRIASGVYTSSGQYAGSFVWRQGAGVGDVGFGAAMGMNSWAQPIAGADVDGAGNTVAALAYSDLDDAGPALIGPYPGSHPVDGFYSQAYGISDDGVVVGLAYDPSANPIAFRWTAQGGMTRLAVERPTTFSRANGISADGTLIFGWNDQLDGYRRGVIWIDGKPTEPHNFGPYGDLFGSPPGEALAANADGSVVVGQGYWDDLLQSEAWRWTHATDAQPIGILFPPPPPPRTQRALARLQPLRGPFADSRYDPRGFFFPPSSYALGVSADGNTIVGNTSDGYTTAAFVWTAADGMVLLSDYASANQIAVPDGFYLLSANAITPDGLTIGGIGIDPTGSFVESWIIDLHPEPLHDTVIVAQGTVTANDLSAGPLSGFPVGTAVSMSLHVAPGGSVVTPARESTYPMRVQSFSLQVNYQDPVDYTRYSATERLDASSAPLFHLRNDDPRADALDLPSTPTATAGQSVQFTLSNADGTLFDSDAASRINRSFGPQVFDATTWSVSGDGHAMNIALQWVTVKDDIDGIFGDGFDR